MAKSKIYYCFSVESWCSGEEPPVVRYLSDGSSSHISFLREFINQYKDFIGPGDDIHMWVEFID